MTQGKKEKKRKEKKEKEDGGEDPKSEKRKRKKDKLERESFAFGFDEDKVSPEEATEDGPHAVDGKERDKKRKKRKDEDDVAPEPPTIQEKEAPNSLEEGAEIRSTESKKDRKHRDKDDVPARHKAVLEKAAKSLKDGPKTAVPLDANGPQTNDSDDAVPDAVEAHGLEPLPQPEPVAQDGVIHAYETLPAWIASPIRVTPQASAPFTDLGISKEVAAKVEAKGYKEAFAVQTAVMPLLLPSHDRQGDVVVSAATGSGKTLAYVLPMVRDISQGVITRLRGVIVVPTRELVMQAKEVCDMCATACAGPNRKTVKTGISMGNKRFEQEQADLVEEEQRFDPAGYQDWLAQHFDRDFDVSLFEDTHKPLPDHVLDYASKVDILICTPGRLVDHINRTPGFKLDYVRWLVVDEADKLLAQTFQDWLLVVMPLLDTTNKPGARDFPGSNKSGVRKVVLSATMTRDLSLLNGLKLSRPKLVTLEGVAEHAEPALDSKAEHALPESLGELAIKIRDPALKPLYLVDLLTSPRMASSQDAGEDVEMADAEEDDSASGAASESEPDTSDSDSDSSDGPGNDSDASEASSTSPERRPSSVAKKVAFRTTALIFTRSNETAIRLSRLLSLLSPALAPLIGTLTSTTRTSKRRQTLRAFASRKLRILVASDLVARGIDLANLDNVINYDMPTSVASYVHRVGRTARANKTGRAWTLFTKTEAGWFWTAIAGKGESKSQSAAGTGHIERRAKIEEVRINDRWEEDKVAEFENALEKLGKEASDLRRKR